MDEGFSQEINDDPTAIGDGLKENPLECDFCACFPFSHIGSIDKSWGRTLHSASRLYHEVLEERHKCVTCNVVASSIEEVTWLSSGKGVEAFKRGNQIEYELLAPPIFGRPVELRLSMKAVKTARAVEDGDYIAGEAIFIAGDSLYMVTSTTDMGTIVTFRAFENFIRIEEEEGFLVAGGIANGFLRTREERVDLDLLCRWDRTCKENGHHCHALPHTASYDKTSIKARLVDVRQKCLVESTLAEPYVALSYVWGRGPVSRPVLSHAGDDKVDYYKPGVFDQGQLPATLWDAMEVTRELGYRLLFVDRLCIDQSKPEDVDKYAESMHQVFGLASVTIIAAAGNSVDSGLPGVGSTRRGPPPPRATFEGGYISFGEVHESELRAQDVAEDQLAQTVWATRAWTFQERLLSPRLLVFTEASVYWMCWQGRYCESVAYEGFNVDASFASVGNDLRADDGVWDLPERERRLAISKKLAALVSSYTVRQLSLQTDILRAFKGILNAFSAVYMPWGFHFAMSRNALLVELAWGVAVEDPEQDDLGFDSKGKLEDDGFGILKDFPSWSWLSVKGEVLWERGAHDLRTSVLGSEDALTTSIFTVEEGRLVNIYTEDRPLPSLHPDQPNIDEAVLLESVPRWLLSESSGLSKAIVFATFLAPCSVSFIRNAGESRQVCLEFEGTNSAKSVVFSKEISWQQYPNRSLQNELVGVITLGWGASGPSRRVQCLLAKCIDGVAYRCAKFSCSANSFGKLWPFMTLTPIVFC